MVFRGVDERARPSFKVFALFFGGGSFSPVLHEYYDSLISNLDL